MLVTILMVLAALIVILVVVVVLQPSELRVTRSATIAAPPESVFAQVNDFHKWEAWNPWAKIDPAMKQTYDGEPSGAGAGYAWVGNNEVGSGRMTIIESKPNELIRIRLDFEKPMKGTNTAEFTFVPEGDATRVTWSMFGEKSFVSKGIGLVMDMDKMIGGNFEKGLADMKAVAEAAPQPKAEEAMSNTSTTATDAIQGNDIVLTRTLDAPRETVWKAWTDPEKIKQWWGPEHFTAPEAKVDLCVGGKYLYCMRSPENQDFWSTGTYREIVPNERIVATDSFADKDGNVVPASQYGMEGPWPDELLVTVTFEEQDGKTKLTLRHEGIPESMREMCAMGWNTSLDKFADVVAAS